MYNTANDFAEKIDEYLFHRRFLEQRSVFSARQIVTVSADRRRLRSRCSRETHTK